MLLREEKRDLFSIENKYYLAHCISSDCKMGSGIAIEFEKRFKLKTILFGNYTEKQRKHPSCIFEKNIFNLITKAEYWHKPTYGSMEKALIEMRNIIIDKNIKFIAMPKIGCGLDKLIWVKVKKIIEEIFVDLDIEILICYL